MKRNSLVILLALVSMAAARPPEDRLARPTSFDVAAIDAYVAAQIKAKGIPGMTLAIVKDGQIALAKGYGNRSLETKDAVTSDTLFAIGSITKQFTCAAVLLLAEENKLSVHDKVGRYFPGLTRANDITLLDLMNHVSGYRDYYPLDFVDRRMATPIAVDELIRRYAAGPLDFEPGSRFSYSNTGFVILGRVVEKVGGEPFETFLKRRILQPLSMTRTAYEPIQRGGEFAQGYTSFALGPPELAKPEAQGWIVAAGGLFSTASDLAKWDLALMDQKVLQPESYRLMTTPRKLSDGRLSDYGCGLRVSLQNGLTVLSHNGALSGFLGYNAMIPATRSAVVLLANCEDGAATGKLHGTLLSLLLPKPPAPPKIAGASAAGAATEFLRRLQSGRIERARLGEEFSHFLSPEKLRGASIRLRPYGKPLKAEVARSWERGGMEVVVVRFSFKSEVLEALMYRSTDGQIQQFFVNKE